MEKQLPKNWVETTLGKISNIVTGNTPSKNNDEFYGNYIPWVKPGDINTANVLYSSEESLSAAGLKKARLVPKGSIMVTCIGNLGNVAMAGVDMTTNQQINSIVLDHNLLYDKYLLFYSITLKKWLIENSTSTTISMVNKSNFEKAPILLPPLAEQERIAEKLDALFGQLDSVRGAMNRIPTLLANLRQQILTHAVTGKLTQEWREKNNAKKWGNKTIRDLTSKVGSGSTPKGGQDVYKSSGVPLIRSMNVRFGKIDYTGLAYIDNDQAYALRGVEVYTDDVLLNITGASIGRVCLAPNDLNGARVNQHVCIIRCKKDIIPAFISIYLSSPKIQSFIMSENYGVTRQALTKEQILNIDIDLPSPIEQEEIVNRVQSLSEKLDSIEQRYQMLKTKLENLPQAILHKAFKGELVEQLPTDGNATDLLHEIEQLKKSLKKK